MQVPERIRIENTRTQTSYVNVFDRVQNQLDENRTQTTLEYVNVAASLSPEEALEIGTVDIMMVPFIGQDAAYTPRFEFVNAPTLDDFYTKKLEPDQVYLYASNPDVTPIHRHWLWDERYTRVMPTDCTLHSGVAIMYRTQRCSTGFREFLELVERAGAK